MISDRMSLYFQLSYTSELRQGEGVSIEIQCFYPTGTKLSTAQSNHEHQQIQHRLQGTSSSLMHF